MAGQEVLRFGLLLLMTTFPSMAQAFCHDNCHVECSNGSGDYGNCYSVCQAWCPDDNQTIYGNGGTYAAPTRQYAAIALSPDTLDYGYSYGWGSQAEAEASAIDYCAKGKSAAKDCAVQLWFYDSCGSLALKPDSGKKDGAWGADWASSKKAAASKALKHCQKAAGSAGCKTEVTFCARK